MGLFFGWRFIRCVGGEEALCVYDKREWEPIVVPLGWNGRQGMRRVAKPAVFRNIVSAREDCSGGRRGKAGQDGVVEVEQMMGQVSYCYRLVGWGNSYISSCHIPRSKNSSSSTPCHLVVGESFSSLAVGRRGGCLWSTACWLSECSCQGRAVVSVVALGRLLLILVKNSIWKRPLVLWENTLQYWYIECTSVLPAKNKDPLCQNIEVLVEVSRATCVPIF